MSIAQEQATVADESSGLDESAEVDEPAAGRAAKLRESTNNAFEQISGFREALRPPTQKWGLKDRSRIALGHLGDPEGTVMTPRGRESSIGGALWAISPVTPARNLLGRLDRFEQPRFFAGVLRLDRIDPNGLHGSLL